MEMREERAPALAAELVRLKPDLIIAAPLANVRAVKQATSVIPIVFFGVIDPVARGLVASLARPGGNVTGLTDSLMEMDGKRLQLLKEAVPTVSRVAVLEYSSGGPPNPASWWRRELEAAAPTLGVTLQFYNVRGPEDFEGAFTAMTTARAEALYVMGFSFFEFHARRIVELAAQNRLPAVYGDTPLVTAGGLLSYAVNARDIRRRGAIYVDKILKGAKPADLPVEQPTKFELAINLKTAKALGLTIPPTLLMRADEVIE
jgi:putative ABC transport system substrate-binding protein